MLKSNKNMLFFKSKEKGFTLVEMLVSIAVFMTVMTIAVGSFISILNANKKSQAMKTVVDNVTFAIDSISRSIKTGQDYKCANSTKDSKVELITSCSEGGNFIQYYNSTDGKYTQYIFVKTEDIDSDSLGEGNIQKRICSLDNDSCGDWQSMTGPVSNINIKNMKFYVLGTGTEALPYGSKKQPRVIITVEGASGDESVYSNTSFMLQTTVSRMYRLANWNGVFI